jgi:5-formyltetrahydrofolate cyclo-ligase
MSQPTKGQIRADAEARRREQPDKDRLSRVICRKLAELPEYAAARTAMLYVHRRHEVRTRQFLRSGLGSDKRIAVPYCAGPVLQIFHLASMEELEKGTFGILEPKAEIRQCAQRQVDVSELDLVVVPGVAFDRRGARMGHGRGYYDKLLAGVRSDTLLVAVAFQCQVFPQIPTESHDVFMDLVITEKTVYQTRRPR